MHLFKTVVFSFILTTCLLGGHPALAIPVTWTLHNVTFEDGGRANGSFVFDADDDSFQNIHITKTDGHGTPFTIYTDLVPLATYGDGWTFTPHSELFLLVANTSQPDLTGQNAFFLEFGLGLTNTQTFVNVNGLSEEGICGTSDCDIFLSAQSRVLTGTMTGVPGIQNTPQPPTAPIPEPASLLLLGSGIAGLTLWRWRNRNPSHENN